MKEFILIKPYETLDKLLNSDEVSIVRNELEKGNIKEYAIVTRIGNRYDLDAKKISGYAINPYYQEKKAEEKDMKYSNIETMIDKEIENEVNKVNIKYAQEIAKIKADHEKEIVALKEKFAIDLLKAKEEAKAELIAKLNA